MSRVGAGLVGIDPSRTTRLRPAMTLTAPLVVRTAGARRHAGRLRPRLPGPRQHLPRAGAARVRRRAAARRLGPGRGRAPRPAACRWSAGSRWTRRSSTSARPVARSARPSPCSARATTGEPTVADWAGVGRHPRARDRHRPRSPGRAEDARGRRGCGASGDHAGGRHRRRPELRARGVAGLGGRRRRGPRPRGVRRRAAHHRPRRDLARPRAAPDGARRGRPGPARLRGGVPPRARAARRGRHARRALRAGRRALRRLRGRRRRAGHGQVGDEAGRRGARHRHRARRAWSPPRPRTSRRGPPRSW